MSQIWSKSGVETLGPTSDPFHDYKLAQIGPKTENSNFSQSVADKLASVTTTQSVTDNLDSVTTTQNVTDKEKGLRHDNAKRDGQSQVASNTLAPTKSNVQIFFGFAFAHQ